MTTLIIFQILGLIFQFYIATLHNRTHVMAVTFLFNFSNLICYLLNNDITAFYSAIIICVRTFVYIFMEKFKTYKWHWVIPCIAIFIQLVIGMQTISNIFELIPILAPCYTCYYLWFYDSLQKLRVGNIIGNSMWFIYNMSTGLYILSVGRAITVFMNVGSFCKNRTKENK